MSSQENQLFCRLDGLTVSAREQQRSHVISTLGLLATDSIPIFEEATQATAQSLSVPICTLGLMSASQERFKSAVGLSTLGLMNELATTRQISRQESFSAYVVDSGQTLIIADTLAHFTFANSSLVYEHGIRAYLGVPLLTCSGECIGALAVMDVVPRSFSQQDVAFLQLMARWGMSEFERQRSQMPQPQSVRSTTPESAPQPANLSLTNQLKVDLLGQLAQDLRTPLTSVMGMASVLSREIYGPLTIKQKEYLDIIHNSGQYLLSLMNEIVELSELKEIDQTLNLSSVDIEMLCQQAIITLEQVAQRRDQQVRLTVEPGRRIWLLDKEKVRLMLYHLIFSIIQSSTAGSLVRLHVSRRDTSLNLSIWVSHPWLGEGLPYTDIYSPPSLVSAAASNGLEFTTLNGVLATAIAHSNTGNNVVMQEKEAAMDISPRKNVGLLLSQHLVELHGGKVTIQSGSDTGFRYSITIPQSFNSVKEQWS
ncbi:GAF domain-containing sensor histidine kinase [Phormidium sp. CLA17]|uniref:GAF domain-containing sensor histidine kinase n=1 Tax=Leptolyngbya sp. Cla-17 TaxID=2803751 RepID=UPI00149285C8|nr:GAF domain-containing sensor histidine kinase [Leptolyngbya sp. Cla-17]MBM0743665.1 GAF domain-containing sensor histidine kinase [Leptolyngbya sp. Cla-17]